MIQSRINTQVQYKEKRTIDAEDIGHESAVYSLESFEQPVVVVLGKANYIYIARGIVFYPLYIVDKDTVRSQIGVVEVVKKDALKVLDEDGDVILSKTEPPLFYSFVTQEYINQTKSNVDIYLRYSKEGAKEDAVAKEIDLLKTKIQADLGLPEEDIEISAEKDVLDLAIPKEGAQQLERAHQLLKEGIFETDTKVNAPPTLVEESDTIAKEIKSNFQESAKTNWLQDFMRNPHYAIHEVERNGDCFFAVVRDAFAQIGQVTTVAKLRAALAAEVTDDIFQEYRKLYLVNLSKKKEYQAEIEKATKINQQLKHRLTKSKTQFNKDESDAILKEAKI